MKDLPSKLRTLALAAFASAVGLSAAPVYAQTSVLTHYYDSGRTGWNQTESVLNPTTVNSTQFAPIISTYVDDQISAQPLVVPGQTISGRPGSYNVVYVATENNTIYAIDSSNGAVLAQHNFGAPVPTPIGCKNNGPNVGIEGTPVIVPQLNTIDFIAYTLVSGVPTYFLHVVSLSTLQDVVPPQTVSASYTSKYGTNTFNATYQRQRPALLYANNNVYAAFGSFCDMGTNISRGWILGWNATTLQPLAANYLTNQESTSPNDYFASSIWMSGSGPAADASGNVYYSTGNSDPSGTTYNGVYNIAETVAKMSPSLSSLSSIFTPSNWAILDQYDTDVSAAGVLAIPQSFGYSPPLVAAGSKDGRLFILNQNNLGGYTPGGPDKVLAEQKIAPCWCAPAIFEGSDGVGRIVFSGGHSVTTWKINQTSSSTQLVADGAANVAATQVQDPGFFTSVSSSGTTANSAVIWGVDRPIGHSGVANDLTLYAFSAVAQNGALPILSSYPAGLWPYTAGNANVVPVVANGLVYVGSYRQLTIFGLTGQSAPFPDLTPSGFAYNASSGMFSAEVQNVGKGSTPSGVAIGVSYLVDGIKVGCGWVNQSLSPGSSVTIGAGCGAATIPSGEHMITVIADDANRMAMSSRANNSHTSAYMAPLPDLVPTSLTYSVSSGLFTSVIDNEGGATPPGVTVGVAYYVDGVKVSCGWVQQAAAETSVTVGSGCGVYTIAPGQHTISVLSDDSNQMVETTRSNNFYSTSIFVPSTMSSATRTTSPMTGLVGPALTAPLDKGGPDQVSGILDGTSGANLIIRNRLGVQVTVDSSDAFQNHMVAPLIVGEAYTAQGMYGGEKTLHATLISRAKANPAGWPADQ